MDKLRVATVIRQRLERRLSSLLDVNPEDLRQTRLGTLVHLIFLFAGTEETIGGFNSTMRGILDLVGQELVWKEPEHTQEEPEKKIEVIN
jgi:hypothetical protein